MRNFLLALVLLLGTFSSFAQSNLSVFSTNPDNSYVDGETLTWTVMITNNGPMPANNVRAFYAVPAFLQPLPPGITKFWWSKENAVPATGGTNTPLNNITPILAVGQTVSYTLHVKVPTGYTGTIPQLEVSYTKSADLEIVNTNNQTIYTPGTQVTYNVTVTNHGPEVADPVSIAMPIPAGITSFSWTGSNGSSGTNAALANNIGVMAVNQVVTYTVTVDIPAAFTGALTTQASVTSPNTVDPVPGCTQCTDTDTSLQDADVVVVNTNNQSVYTAGGTTVYTFTVTNNGPAAATNVVVTDTFPAGATVTWAGSNGSSGTGNLSNAIGTMALNQTVTYTVTVGVPAGYNAATFVSQAAVTSDKDPVTACTQCTDTDINPANLADLTVTNTDGQTTYTPGSTVVYTLTVANTGPNAAQNVNVQMAIPAGITQFSWQGTNGSAGTNAPLNNTQNSLPNGTSIVYTITVVVPASYQGDLTTQAVVTSNNDPTPACTQCIDIDTSATPTANIVVTNTDGIEIYTPGTNNTYTVTVTNNGPYPAQNVVVSNPVPAGITAFTWTGSNTSAGTGALNNTIPTMAVGQTVTYTIILGVPAGYTGNLSSVTTVTSSTADPVTTDNTVADVDSNTASADLVVTKTLNQGATYTAGADAIYTIVVRNEGPTVAQNVSVTDAIPAGLPAANATWYGSNGTTGTGSLNDVLATLPAGQQVTYTLTVPVPSNYSTTANIVNQVVVTSDTPDPNPACPGCTHTATPNPQANIVTWKSNGQTQYFANAQTVYTIVVTNPGPSDAVNVVVHDSKPYNVDLMTWNGNGTGGAGTLHNVIPVLAAGQTIEYTVTISVKANHPTFVGNLTNVVTVTSDTPDPVPACPGCTDVDTPRANYVTVDQNAYTTEELVNDVLINTDCINVSNIQASAGDINGNYGIGYFNKNNALETSFPIQEGIIIRNGHAKFSEGKYTDQNISSTASGLLDPELSLYAPNNETMNDVSYLQFEFVPLSDEMSFDFLFAANEYGFFQCGWYDTFAFILKDLTDTTILPKNCAVIPGTNTPVSVGTIRKQIYNTACGDANPTYFYQYNVTEPGLSNSSINHRGQTIKMQASSTVVPGHLYSIKMAVGDRGDTAYDSAVFLAAGSFNIGQPTLPSDFTIGEVPGNSAALCPGEEHELSAIFSGNTTFILRWEKDGVEMTDPVTGAPLDTATITVSEPGIYTLKAAFPSDPTCFLTDDIKVEYRPEIEVADPIDLVVCGDPAQPHVFNLQTNDPIMKATLQNPDFIEIEYYHSQEEIEQGLPKIPNSEAANYMGQDGEVIYVGAVGYDFPCYTIRQFTLRIHDCEIEMEPYAVHICEPAPYDNTEVFDLTSYTDEMTVIDPIPAGYVYTFYNNQADAESAQNPIANPETYPGTTETVWVRAQDESVTDVLVYGVAPLTLQVDPQPEVGTYTDQAACGSYTLTAPTGGNYYTGPGGTGTQIDPAVPLTATQTVYVYAQSGTAPNTCTDEASFEVTIYPAPEVVEVADLQACDTYVLPALTVGNYYTAAGGTGTQLAAGTPITTTQTLYIYAVTGDATNVCSDESDFVVTINSAPVVNQATPLEECADNFDGFAYFDLTQAGAEILNGTTGLLITYHETETAAQNGVNIIPTPANYHSINGIVYASVIQDGTTTNCRTVVPIQLIVNPRPAVPVMTV
ncbi:choice-of-anchor L domain-containing protein, partial [Flavobacterium sp. DG1-102-2]|uniref:choice-of-anchor L domain-containing protein n=1 Tax=Flavobacterium sp. DG1-102-2 TaxID=3081663 RepID=UPI00294971BA